MEIQTEALRDVAAELGLERADLCGLAEVGAAMCSVIRRPAIHPRSLHGRREAPFTSEQLTEEPTCLRRGGERLNDLIDDVSRRCSAAS